MISQPHLSRHPEMWLLSASQRSAKLAATQGMGYTLEHSYYLAKIRLMQLKRQ